MFLDGVANGLATRNYNVGANSTCDNNNFVCGISNFTDYSALNSIYPLLKVNYKLISQNHHKASIFLYKNSEVAYLNQIQLGVA